MVGGLTIAFVIGGSICALSELAKCRLKISPVAPNVTEPSRNMGLKDYLPQNVPNIPLPSINDNIIKPMLLSNFDESLVMNKFPVICQPKIDGIRMLVHNGVGYSRTLKPIPNIHLQKIVHENAAIWQGFDGEISAGDNFQDTQSIMSKDQTLNWKYHIFDRWDMKKTKFSDRITSIDHPIIDTVVCDNLKELYEYEQKCLADGYEGVVIRNPNAYYKSGRAAGFNVLKLKRFMDSEAKITAINKDGLTCMGMRNEYQGLIVNIASPYILSTLDIGDMIKIKHKGFTVSGKPRHATFIGVRNSIDIEPVKIIALNRDPVVINEAISALVNLGYKKRSVSDMTASAYEIGMCTGDLIKAVLAR